MIPGTVTEQVQRPGNEYASCLPDGIGSEAGTYALVLRAQAPARIQVGRWGALDVSPGHYLYVGSAFGPGGVRARVRRHCRDARKLRWHIDYLRNVTVPVAAWCTYGRRDFEHRWAQAVSRLPGVSSVVGFGCSDCRCDSHLFASSGNFEVERFCILAGVRPDVWPLHAVSQGAEH